MAEKPASRDEITLYTLITLSVISRSVVFSETSGFQIPSRVNLIIVAMLRGFIFIS